ncbi:ribose-5-phosphate isomerase RpiA [Brochothrix campestris]|uniref:Ribose-5-phosphate isomerase A n=1 Tax=Brochothrix campestris FSL F6-1037 TaxID=1265861 RepID=W7CIQ6_9LIST|nr:ribose-5-phosphate isomerase RpiA [Brochothrix campestris]EUJ39259.1 ribose-5-phosphate isomerase A [Brochothrix campestris FSL F6-1037]
MNGKQAAGERAVDYIKDGMIVGLGTGSTVFYFLQALAKKVAEGLQVTGVVTSMQTAALAKELNIPLMDLNEATTIDVCIDGADEIFVADGSVYGIKGGGGALLFEKLVAEAAQQRIWIADESKTVTQLGAFGLPVEVVQFGYQQLERALAKRGYNPVLRRSADETPYLTDSGNYILDLQFEPITEPLALATELKHMTGVVEHGLFNQMTEVTIIATATGAVSVATF